MEDGRVLTAASMSLASTNELKNRQTDRQTNRQTNGQTDLVPHENNGHVLVSVLHSLDLFTDLGHGDKCRSLRQGVDQ